MTPALSWPRRRPSSRRLPRSRPWPRPGWPAVVVNPAGGGVWHMRAQGNAEDGAQVMATLAPITDRAFHAARRAGRREAPDAYAFDALVTLAMEATSDAPRTGSDATSTSQRGQPRRRR